jgi:hypothetical protein
MNRSGAFQRAPTFVQAAFFVAGLGLFACAGPHVQRVTSPAPVAASSPAAASSTAVPAAAARPHGHRRPGFALRDGKSGAPLPREAFAERLRSARAIYVGEQHDSRHSHLSQLDVLAQTYAISRDLALGIEMLPRRLQPQIDAFLAGALDEAGFLAAVDWEHTWGFDYGLYRPLFEFCRTHGLRLYALNAPRELVRAVRQRGIAGLSVDERALLPSGHPWPMPEAHRLFIRQIFDSHPGGSKGPGDAAERDAIFERFYLAQLIWDESMAQAVSEILAAPSAPARLLILAGVGHVGPHALPGRATRRGVSASLTIGPVEQPSDPIPTDAESVDVVVVIGTDGPSP